MLPEQPAQEQTGGIQTTMESTQAMLSCPEDSHGRDNVLHFSSAFSKRCESVGLTEITQEEIQLGFPYRMHVLLTELSLEGPT